MHPSRIIVRLDYYASRVYLNGIREGIDFATAALVFDGPVQTTLDERRDYGEERMIAIGEVKGTVIVVVYTDRGELRRIISARRANRKERETWRLFARR